LITLRTYEGKGKERVKEGEGVREGLGVEELGHFNGDERRVWEEGRERRGGNLYATSSMKKNKYATSKIRR
jgi:hypothetical protein